MNTNSSAFADLCDILSARYPDQLSSRRIVSEVGLNAGRIAFSNVALDTWYSILTEAKGSGRVERLLGVVLTENETDLALRNACEAYRLEISAEPAHDGDGNTARRYRLAIFSAVLLLAALSWLVWFTIFPRSPLVVRCSVEWPTHSVDQNPTSPNVSAIQYLLRHRGFAIEVSGEYTSATQATMMDFQRESGLPSTGVIEPNTWDKLVAVVQKDRARKDAVRAVQHLLNHKFEQDYVAVDGIFGDITEGAVIDFQEANHLNANGVVGKKTWSHLVCNP